MLQDQKTPNFDVQKLQMAPIVYELAGGRGSIVLIQKTIDDKPKNSFEGKSVYVVYRDHGALVEAVSRDLERLVGREATMMKLADVKSGSIAPGGFIVSFLEIDEPLLATSSEAEMAAVKEMTDNASTLVWVTGNDLLAGGAPTRASCPGSRAPSWSSSRR